MEENSTKKKILNGENMASNPSMLIEKEYQIEVTLKFYLPYNQEEFTLYSHAPQLAECLYEIDNKCRSIIKNNTYDESVGLAEDIREMISEIREYL